MKNKFSLAQPITSLLRPKVQTLVCLLLLSPWATAQKQNTNPLYENHVFKDQHKPPFATLHLSNGNTITFMKHGHNLQISESGDTGAEELSVLDLLEGDPLDKFLQLTSEATPIPEALLAFASSEPVVESDEKQRHYQDIDPVFTEAELLHKESQWSSQQARKNKQLNNRSTVPFLPEPVFVDLQTAAFESVDLSTKGAGQGSCNNSTGYLYFEDNHCGINGSKGKGSTASSCDNAMHNSVNRWSTSGKRVTFTRAAYCGNDHAYINHYTYFSQWNQGWVKLGPTIFLDPYTFRSLETWAGKYDLPRKRRAYINRTSNSGYVRAWNKFYRKVK